MILEMLSKAINNTMSSKKHYPTRRRMLEAKIKATWKEVNQLSEFVVFQNQ